MKENNNIPEPEIFTAEIEDTIDDLFKPSKNIEIDPLTQEVKELSIETENSAGDPVVEFELAEKESSPVEAHTALEEEAIESGQDTGEKPDTLLELDLELELEDNLAEKTDEQPQAQEEGPQPPTAEIAEIHRPDEEADLEKRLEQLNQQLLTIEWEVTEPQLHQTLDILANILASPEVNSNERARSLLKHMEEVLLNIQFHPETIQATAPSVLKKTSRHLNELLYGKETEEGQTDKLLKELKALIAKPSRPHVEEEQPFHAEIQVEAADIDEEQKEDEVLAAPQERQRPQGESARTDTPQPGTAFTSDEGRRLIETHLAELKRCINRIEPLEKLLSKTPGMEKLYKFQHDMRLTLEGQLSELSDFFFRDGQLNLPEILPVDEETSPAADTVTKETDNCAWKELLCINIDGMEIGIPADQVVYMSTPPWHSRSALKKADTVELSRLKPWPWSKLKGLFQGRLAGTEDSLLSSMSFPIVRHLGGQGLSIPSGFIVIILFDGTKGAALLAGEKPLRIEIPSDAECKKEQAEGFEAEIHTHGNRIKVATVASMTQG